MSFGLLVFLPKPCRSSSESERERARNVESREGLDNRKEAKEEGRKATRTDSGDDGQQKRSTTTRRKDSEQAEGPSAKNEVDREQELAATKIQSRMRGKQARLGVTEPSKKTLHPGTPHVLCGEQAAALLPLGMEQQLPSLCCKGTSLKF